MSQREILTNGSAFKRTDGRWCGVVWYKDEHGERKRKSFSGTTKAEVNKKMKKYIVEFNEDKNDSVESLKTLEEGLQNWLQVFKFPAVERTTYDRAESIAKNQIYSNIYCNSNFHYRTHTLLMEKMPIIALLRCTPYIHTQYRHSCVRFHET